MDFNLAGRTAVVTGASTGIGLAVGRGRGAAEPTGPRPALVAIANRVHLDVRAGTGLVGAERLAALEAECARLVALGAVRGGYCLPMTTTSRAS